jgi:hypothetical protein
MRRLYSGHVCLLGLAAALTASDANVRHTDAHLAGIAFDVIPDCRLPVGVVSYSDQKDIPVVLRNAVKQKLGYLVPPRPEFDATDVVVTGQNRRLIFIWTRSNVWVVATEHGGRGYNDPILAYTVDQSGKRITLAAERIASPNTVCSTARELLSPKATAGVIVRYRRVSSTVTEQFVARFQ